MRMSEHAQATLGGGTLDTSDTADEVTSAVYDRWPHLSKPKARARADQAVDDLSDDWPIVIAIPEWLSQMNSVGWAAATARVLDETEDGLRARTRDPETGEEIERWWPKSQIEVIERGDA